MIQFFVNNNEIVLPEDFYFSWTEENPLVTSDGEFSLDMTVSLLEPKNAIAFKFLNRLNIQTIEKKADAKLIDDGRVHSGTILITRNNDIEVIFQFLAGNSELKYIARNEKKIWQFDWGTESEIDFTKAMFTLNHPGYGEVSFGGSVLGFNNYVCAPVKVGDVIINDYLIDSQTENFAIISEYYNVTQQIPLPVGEFYMLTTAVEAIPAGLRKGAFALIFSTDDILVEGYQYTLIDTSTALWNDVANWKAFEPKRIMQPYILYYINKFPEMLGYTLKNNILNDDPRAKRTYLVNTVDSLKYSDALPDMSVTEFKEAVETFFNVEFVVDPRDKSISIQSLDSSIAEKKVVTLDLALDSYDRDMSQESISSRLDFTQAGYDLPDSDFCKYQKISDDNLLKCTIREFNTFADIVTYVASATSIANKLIIYRDIEKNRDYFVRDSRDGIEAKIEFYSTKVGNYSLICMINKLKYFGTSTDNTLLFSLYPAPLATDEKRIIYTRSGSAQSEFGLGFQLPQASNSYYVPKAKGFIETIEESGSDTPRNSKLEVSLFTGRIQIYPKTVSEYGNLVNYPFSHIDEYPEFPAPYHDWVNLVYKPAITKTMLLNGPNGVITDYHSSKYVDTSKEYTFTTIDSPDISANNIFVIDNLKYLPISFEWEKGNKKQPVDGKLYRML